MAIIHRTIFNSIERQVFPGGRKQPAIVIYGPRQAGKTTLARQLIDRFPERAEYVDCDYLDARETFAYERADQLGGIVHGLKLLVLDEAQRIENIGLVLKILVDRHPHVQVVATGSSSFDLSNRINEPLTGRKREFLLLPFSYEELHVHDSVLIRRRALERWLRFGGYPDVVAAGDSEAEHLLHELTENYLFKDIFMFQHLRKPELLGRLLRLLAFQIGSEVSYHELAQQLQVDQTVVQHYIALLEAAFVIVRLGAYKRNLRTEVSRSRKVYFWDCGVRNALIRNTAPLNRRNDVGALWENFCIAERLKRNSNHQRPVNTFFWRTYGGREIDYLEEAGGTLSTFECTWNERKAKRPPKAFLAAYPHSAFTLIRPSTVHEFLTGTGNTR